jgi:hypothetical protein
MGTPQEVLETILQPSLSVSPCSIGNVLKCLSERLGEAPMRASQDSQSMPRSRAAQLDTPFRMAEMMLAEVMAGYDRFHNMGRHSVAFRLQDGCYAVIKRLVGTDVNSKEFPDASTKEFRDKMARYKMIIGKYIRGEEYSPQEISELKNFCDTICRLAENYRAPEYEH